MAQLDESIVDGQSGHLTDHEALHRKANYVFDVKDYGAVGDGTTDDTAAIQAAIDAAEAANGGVVYLPTLTSTPVSGFYLTSSPLTINNDAVNLVGGGKASMIRNNTTNVLELATTTACDFIKVADLSLVCGASGKACIEIAGVVSRSRFDNLVLRTYHAGASCLVGDADNYSGWDLTDNLFTNVIFDGSGIASTVPLVDFHLNASGGWFAENTFIGGRVNSNSGTTEVAWKFRQDNTTNYFFSPTLQGINFNGPAAGALAIQGTQNLVLRDITIWDISALSDDIIEFTTGTGGNAPDLTLIENYRNHVSADILGTSYYDIKLTNGTLFTILNSGKRGDNGRIDLYNRQVVLINPDFNDIDNILANKAIILGAKQPGGDQDATLGGDLIHLGDAIGFYGTTPAAQSSAYTPTNVTADRAYDANATTLDEVADVLGTLIADLQATGLIG